VATILATAIERVEREREMRRQRERLAALNHIDAIVRDVIRALVRQSTREEVERLVCERLADSDSYEFAWVGAVEQRGDEVQLRTEAGVEDYLADTTITVDDSETGRGPTGRAFRTGEVQVCRDVMTGPDYERWRETAREYGYRASAAVPITYENTIYGVLNVYTARPDAFGAEEREVIEGLGEVIGHAINAIERERLLMGDEVVELEFQVRDMFAEVGMAGSHTGTVTVEQTVPAGDDTYLVYGTATEDATEWLPDLADHLPYWSDVSVIGEEFGTHRFEARLEDPPVLSLVRAHSGHVRTAQIEDGDYRLTIELPPDAPVREVVESVTSAYPGAEMLAQRRTVGGGGSGSIRGFDLEAVLTERQAAAVEAAYFAGFFEWPRDSTGEEVAESLGISPPTFHQHLRAAERRLLAAIVEGELPDKG